MRMRTSPRGGAAKGDATFRFLPACGPKEIVCSQKRVAPFQMPSDSASKVRRMEQKIKEMEVKAEEAKTKIEELEDDVGCLEQRIDELGEDNEVLSKFAEKVNELIKCRKKKDG